MKNKSTKSHRLRKQKSLRRKKRKSLQSKKISNILNRDNMDTKEKIKLANQILNNNGQQVKVLKTDNSLIERTLSSRVIITEDNRELLRD